MSPSAVRRRAVVVEALRRPGLRRVCSVAALFQLSELGSWIAVTAYAHSQGGVNEASAVLAAQLAPAAIAALFVDRLAARLGAARVLAGGLVAQSAGLFGVAALIALDAPRLLVYASAVLAATAVVTARPTIAGLLVDEVDDPHQLTAAHSLIGWTDGCASFLGPALTGIGFAAVGTEAPFLVFGASTLTGGLLAGQIRERGRPVGPDPDVEAESAAPTRVRWNDIGPLLAVLAGQAFVVGALDLLFVVVAVDITDGDAARAGFLNSMFGIGALLGAAGTVLLIGRHRIWPAVLLAGAVMSVALSLVGATTSPLFAGLALAGCGLGVAALSVSARTLLQRVSDLSVLCRAFSMAEAFEMGMLLVGTATVPLFVSLLGARSAPLGVAAIGAVVVLVALRPMAASEARSPLPVEHLDRLAAHELFDGLDSPALGTVARAAVAVSVVAGQAVVTEGEPGDDYFVVVSGRLAVTVDGSEIGELGPGEGFGELALLYDLPRSATVTATEPTQLLAIERFAFLVAASRSPAAAARTYAHRPPAVDPVD